MTWTGSTRRSQLPKDWHRRRAIAKRDAGGQCQWVQAGERCTQPGTDCDHIDRRGNDEPDNLQWLCRTHHNIKTASESQAARLPRTRATGRHPGFL